MNRYQSLAAATKVHPFRTSDKTLFVEGVPRDWPCEQGSCLFVAKYVLRAALEQGCAYVEVRQGATHRHRFDVGLLLVDCSKVRGWQPAPHMKIVPRFFHSGAHKANGGEFGATRTQVTVPQSLCLSDGKKEHTNGQ